ncbi:hypothetical protein C0Q70_03308 [Pomacea canaliculata]|uniref:Uncharacterized protein n=1 Tax=Pomacea canaliculata TaxID=400727 RepID=A0A2T7PSD2_POMCA|nr:hypothetical protein C0Q70_03308 [Pomacea canaliculata]
MSGSPFRKKIRGWVCGVIVAMTSSPVPCTPAVHSETLVLCCVMASATQVAQVVEVMAAVQGTRQGSVWPMGLAYTTGSYHLSSLSKVWTQQPGTGCVTVAVYGPRSHCVTETNVAYIGDNVYDVTYSVTTPGYYIIVVKWGNKSLPDSPFICKVTY